MGTQTYTQPNNTTQSGSAYKSAIDDGTAVLAYVAQDFACHQNTVADMQVLIDAGKIVKADGTLVSQNQQTTSTIIAPVTNPRIDRIVFDSVTGVYSIVPGTEAVSPTAPAIPAGKLPCAQILLQTTTTAITNALITDERTFIYRPGAPVLAKTGAYAVAITDIGSLIVAASGTWALSLPAAATAGNSFVFEFYNAGTGAITIDPNGSEAINGATTLDVGPGGRGRIICSGSAWYAVGNFDANYPVTLSANTTLTLAHAGLLLVDATGGNVILTLPAAGVLAIARFKFVRMDTSANTVTIQRAGSDTIDGAASHPLDYYSSIEIVSNGSNEWLRIGRTVGQPFMWPGSSAPAGALKLNGAAVSRTAYKRLFALLGTTYGAGDGSTTFNLPDDRGYFWRAFDDARGVDSGRTLGSYQADDFKSHTHVQRIWSANSNSGNVPIGYQNVNAEVSGPYSTQATGGTETRPVNRAYLACITY